MEYHNVSFNELVFPQLKHQRNDLLPLNLTWEALDEPLPEPQPFPVYNLTADTQELIDEPQVSITQGNPPRPATVDEIQLADDPALACPNSEPNCLPICIKVIGARHLTLISSTTNPEKISSYPRGEGELLITLDDTPNTYNKAISGTSKEVWLEAINKELLSMEKLNVWDIVEVDPTYKLVGTTWVFKTKRNHLNQVVEHKAQLCAQGFTQTPGINFEKTYSPTGRLNSLCTLIAFLASNGLLFHQINVKSTFVNAPLFESIYLGIPQGLRSDKQKYCLHLKKAIYGLRQAPLAWYKHLKG
ncbi:hypothetical protein O181_109151 [Austropuccinia psidii MF-1]|uniref:Reverse transcriptase Ty1/copia-type domain-containing protein n=1 Tax=Austropuccinia psidii MF-1 TaxID=1389203 RepID=A0A9Q3PQM7_9BASI|nr:hypothetical protein [Austropuccinia psidii MF-1]